MTFSRITPFCVRGEGAGASEGVFLLSSFAYRSLASCRSFPSISLSNRPWTGSRTGEAVSVNAKCTYTRIQLSESKGCDRMTHTHYCSPLRIHARWVSTVSTAHANNSSFFPSVFLVYFIIELDSSEHALGYLTPVDQKAKQCPHTTTAVSQINDAPSVLCTSLF